MKQSAYIYLLLAVVCACCVSCRKPRPQLPSNRVEPDTVSLSLLRAQQQLVEATDRELTRYISSQDTAFVLHDMGFWYIITKRTASPRFLLHETAQVWVREYDMQGRLLCDNRSSVVIGKMELTRAVDQMLLLMRKGESARMIVPWYMAYGVEGNDCIEPYTNLIIELQTENKP